MDWLCLLLPFVDAKLGKMLLSHKKLHFLHIVTFFSLLHKISRLAIR